MSLNLREYFGNIDIYLFDQILRGNLTPDMTVLDAGCGYGRNLSYLLRSGCEVYAVDAQVEAVEKVRDLAVQLGADLGPDHFLAAPLERMPLPDSLADAVICSAVLHFARSDAQFRQMLREMWRVLKPGGLFFCRLGSSIGMQFMQLEGRLHQLPGGVTWYLVDEPLLLDLTQELGGVLVDPLKTTIVQDARCMTTWVVRKPHRP